MSITRSEVIVVIKPLMFCYSGNAVYAFKKIAILKKGNNSFFFILVKILTLS